MPEPLTPYQTVREFIRRIEGKDVDGALELATDDVEYENVPTSTAHGKDAARQTLTSFLAGVDAVEWVVHRQTATENVVLNERTDRFLVGGRWIEIGVAGVWELRDGQIGLWRDYFDVGQVRAQLDETGSRSNVIA